MIHNKKKQREANFELLRICAMAFVVVLHFLSKGEVLTEFGEKFTATSYTAWFLEAFAIIAVNVYVLMTGYFMCEASFKCRRIISLIAQVLFYSTIIPTLLTVLGIIEYDGITLYELLQGLLPFHMDQYWFMSTYVILFLLSPVLNAAIRSLEKKQLKLIILLLLFYESLIKTILPVKLTGDSNGYGIVWFIVLYLTAAYIRKYGIVWFSSLRKSAVTYIISAICTFIVMLMLRFVYLKYDMLGDSIGYSYHYNFIMVYVASIAFFYIFYYMQIKEGVIASCSRTIAPYVLGVYLFHEELHIRYVWPTWFGMQYITTPVQVIIYTLYAVTAIMAIGIFIDYIRSKLFDMLARGLKHTPIEQCLNVLDQMMKIK